MCDERVWLNTTSYNAAISACEKPTNKSKQTNKKKKMWRYDTRTKSNNIYDMTIIHI